MTAAIIDTHTHLDGEEFFGDLETVIASSRASGVTRWINVGFSPDRWNSTLALVESIDGMSHMLGMHPGNADDWNPDNARALSELVRTTHPVAIGEIGLDLHWRRDNLELQIAALREQLMLAESADLPAVIHMRRADEELLDFLEAMPSLPHLHFHSFDGGERLCAWAESHRCTIGVGGLMTRIGSDSLRAWIQRLPRERVVLETDSPWLKPHGIRGKRNEPAFLNKVADHLADLWNLRRSDLNRLTTDNACRIFNLDPKELT